jgi:uncharacterized protein (DUF58 family)
VSPTPRAALALALIALAALVVPLWVVILAALGLAGAIVADALLVRPRPSIRRGVPEILSRGVGERLDVEARSPAAASVTVRQATPPDIGLDPHVSRAPLRAVATALRRGRHMLPPAAARLEGPLGLAAWYRAGGGEAAIDVYPDLPAARRQVAGVRHARFRDQGLRGRGPLGLGTEFESVREYSPDDDIRQVNWLATARLGRPMSNEFRLEQDRDVVAVIDAGRLMASPITEATLLDLALDAVTALAAVADELGDRFGAISFDDEVRHRLAPRREGGARAVRALYDLEPTPVDSDYSRGFRAVSGAKRAFVVVFTDLLEEVAARSLLEAVPVLARRHAVAVAAPTDPELTRMADADESADDGLDAYRAVVAADVLAARRRVATRLRHAGADVIEVEPERLGAACVRAYLRAKSRARI